jgi:hypothetical protein
MSSLYTLADHPITPERIIASACNRDIACAGRVSSACSGEVDTGSPTKNMRHSRNDEHVPITQERDML